MDSRRIEYWICGRSLRRPLRKVKDDESGEWGVGFVGWGVGLD